MKPSFLYRIVSILLVLFSAGHTLGFARLMPAGELTLSSRP